MQQRKFIIIYYPKEKNNELSVYEVEVDESSQMNILKSARMNRE